MIRLLPVAAILLLVACEPPAPRAKVQKPFPTEEATTPEATPGEAGAPTAASLVGSVPAQVDAIEERHRALSAQLTEAERVLQELDTAIRAAESPERHADLQERAAELRATARALASDAAELSREADRLRDTSERLKAIGGTGQ